MLFMQWLIGLRQPGSMYKIQVPRCEVTYYLPHWGDFLAATSPLSHPPYCNMSNFVPVSSPILITKLFITRLCYMPTFIMHTLPSLLQNDWCQETNIRLICWCFVYRTWLSQFWTFNGIRLVFFVSIITLGDTYFFQDIGASRSVSFFLAFLPYKSIINFLQELLFRKEWEKYTFIYRGEVNFSTQLESSVTVRNHEMNNTKRGSINRYICSKKMKITDESEVRPARWVGRRMTGYWPWYKTHARFRPIDCFAGTWISACLPNGLTWFSVHNNTVLTNSVINGKWLFCLTSLYRPNQLKERALLNNR